MSNVWFRDSWMHLMGDIDALLGDVRSNAAELDRTHAIHVLLDQAEYQRAAAEAALHHFAAQRQALLEILDQMQRELAVAGHPLRGEIS